MIPVDLLAAALSADTPVQTHRGPAFLRLHQVGRLRVESGEIAVADLDPLDAAPFTRVVPPGDHPVLVGVTEDAERCRAAFVLVRFSSESPVAWESARRVGETEVEAGLVGVDSGSVSIAEPEVLGLLLEDLEPRREVPEFAPGCRGGVVTDDPDQPPDEDEFLLPSDDEDDDDYDDDPPPTARSVAVVQTGEGDGIFPCAFGLDESGEVAALLVDFESVTAAG